MSRLEDPVCKMQLTEEDAAESCVLEGEKYFFCSAECKTQFEEAPQKYARSRSAA